MDFDFAPIPQPRLSLSIRVRSRSKDCNSLACPNRLQVNAFHVIQFPSLFKLKGCATPWLAYFGCIHQFSSSIASMDVVKKEKKA